MQVAKVLLEITNATELLCWLNALITIILLQHINSGLVYGHIKLIFMLISPSFK